MDKLREKVRNLLNKGKVAGYVGYINAEGNQPLPHFFVKERLAEVEQAIVPPGDARYPLDKILQSLAAASPDATFAIQVRGCDERGLNELYKWGQLVPDKVVVVGVACPQDQADYCECPGSGRATSRARHAAHSRPWPRPRRLRSRSKGTGPRPDAARDLQGPQRTRRPSAPRTLCPL